MAQNKELRQLKDYDVLGVGATRREELRLLGGESVLWTHSFLVPPVQREVYEALFQETLLWLKPRTVQEYKINKPMEDYLFEVLLEDFRKQFPQTSEYLKHNLKEVLGDYLKEIPWQGPLLTAHFKYFPVFLKRKIQDSRLYLIMQKEWLWSYLNFADFGFPPPEAGRILVNPSLQSLYVGAEVGEVRMTPGLWLVYYDYSQRKVRDYKMDIWDAVVVDVLQEDRKYSLEQLVDQVLVMESVNTLTREEWRKKFFYLRDQGILLESGSGWILDRK